MPHLIHFFLHTFKCKSIYSPCFRWIQGTSTTFSNRIYIVKHIWLYSMNEKILEIWENHITYFFWHTYCHVYFRWVFMKLLLMYSSDLSYELDLTLFELSRSSSSMYPFRISFKYMLVYNSFSLANYYCEKLLTSNTYNMI